MSYIKNNSNKSIIVGSVALKPGRCTEMVVSLADLKKKYPLIAEKAKDKLIEEVSADNAAKSNADLDNKVKEAVNAAGAK